MVNERRFDPYKNFKFRESFAALRIAVLGIVKKLLRSTPEPKRKKKRSGARPIAAVGTSTAGFVGTAPKKRRKKVGPTSSRSRKGPRKPKTGAS